MFEQILYAAEETSLFVRSCSLGQEYNDTNDYFNVATHEVEQREELEYEVMQQLFNCEHITTTLKYCTFSEGNSLRLCVQQSNFS